MATDFRYPGIADYAEAYRAGATTPSEVAERVLEATRESDTRRPPLRLFIAQDAADVRAQAEASSERFRRGAPLGPLDGVPVAIKDEVDQRGYGTTVGTTFLGRTPAAADSTVVARLRAAGAVLIGKANMHEIGLGVTGINPHYGPARNPHDPARITGGSSSGSAAAVACGLCPAAIGADGGGSIRIPASLCGVAGIKATFGRVSEVGAAPLCWSLAHVGPLAGSLSDAAQVLEVIAGPDAGDPNTLGQPPLELDAGDPDLAGVRIGWCGEWARLARAEVAERCRRRVDQLATGGAEVVEVGIEHLEWVPLVQYVTIGVEIAASQYEQRREHMRDYAADTRLLLAMANRMPAVDYVRAQRLRGMIHASFVAALARVDVLATPMTAASAVPIPEDALKGGQSDDAVLEAMTAFSFAANLTGQPAVTVPVGHDEEQGMPFGLQLIARHWDEAKLVRVGLAAEALAERRRPQVLYEPLSDG